MKSIVEEAGNIFSYQRNANVNLSESLKYEELRVASHRMRKPKEKVTKLSAREVARIAISASRDRREWLKRYVQSGQFLLAEIPLRSVAVIDTYSNGRLSLRASLDDTPIIVDVNKNKIGKTGAGYVPRVIVIDGAYKHRVASNQGETMIKAWIGAEAALVLGIMADDQFGAQELQDKINECLRQKYVKKNPKNGETIGPYPWIKEVYPFENYFVYQYDGDLFKQNFKCDVKKRTVKLDGDPEEVKQKYVDLDSQTSMGKSMKMAMGPSGPDANMGPKRGTSTLPAPKITSAPTARVETKTPVSAPRFSPATLKFSGQPEVQRTTDMGNRPRSIGAYMGNNATSPGSGVGPRVKMAPPRRSELGEKL